MRQSRDILEVVSDLLQREVCAFHSVGREKKLSPALEKLLLAAVIKSTLRDTGEPSSGSQCETVVVAKHLMQQMM